MLNVLRERHSVRHYEDRDIEPEIIEQLKEAVLRAPSSRGLHPWRFVFVTDRALLEALSHSKANYAGFVAGARLAVAICADENISDVWIEDCAIAGIIPAGSHQPGPRIVLGADSRSLRRQRAIGGTTRARNART
jgi:nitroreductase